MNELIKIEINENNEQLVSAKELHEFLEVKSKFADWIKNRIEKYGFEENQDFVTVSKNLENGGREIDYILKLDTAKELAMAENNEKKEKKMELMKKDLIMTSLEIAEITEKRHDHVLRDIREEIASLESEGLGGQLIFGASSYKNSQNKEQPMYTMGREGAIQIATRYSAAIRRKLIMKLEELENKIKVPTTLKEALQLALEQQEKLEKQQLVIQEKSKIIKEKVEVIDNLTEDVDSVLLRKIATDYVSKKAKETSKPHPEIWGDIYGLFGRELKINLANRFDKYKQEQYDLIAFNLHYNKVNNLKGEDKKTPYTKKEIKKLSKVEYICKVLKKGGLLIEIMAKVFEIPTEDIIGKYKDYEFDDTKEIILIDGSDY